MNNSVSRHKKGFYVLGHGNGVLLNVLSIEDLLYQQHPRYELYLYKVIIHFSSNDITYVT